MLKTMISGYDNIIFSDTCPKVALYQFTDLIKKKWDSFLEEEEWSDILLNCQNVQKPIEFFFCKDKRMMSFHDKRGYSIDKNGEGCFSLYINFAKRFNASISIEKEIENSIGDFNRDPYEAKIVLNGIYEYTLVTPENPNTDEFSRFLIESLIQSLTRNIELV